MAITINNGGTLHELGEVIVNNGGTLYNLAEVKANNGGVLNTIFSAATPIGNYNVEDIVQINENDTPVDYIIVHKGLPSSIYDSSCNGVWLLRKTALDKSAWHTSNYNNYAISTVKTRLEDDFFNTIDSKIAAAIKTVKIPYRADKGTSATVTSGANGLSCKVFLLSGYEVGSGENEYMTADGACLSYFAGIGNIKACTKRVCNDVSGSAIQWWLRSPGTNYESRAWRCELDGSLNCGGGTSGMCGVRPAFILPHDFKI